ncbi:xanthine dehydrogenase family protein subunit M [bacterium]|nr:xanthine dehydrogenase family protein subunit M [bacterium]
MRDFDYVAPTSLQQAVELLAKPAGQARPLAGGTDLIDHVRNGRLSPDVLVDIKKIPELNLLEAGPNGLRLGAAVNCATIAAHQAVQAQYTALVDSCQIIGGVQIQSRASVGGNMCNSGPAADSTPSVIALGGRCVITGAQGTREVAAEDFCTGPGKNVLKPGELLVELRFPAPAPHTGSHYRRFIPRNEMDIAVVGIGVSVTLDDTLKIITAARIALGAVGPTPILATAAAQALIGQPATDETYQKAVPLAREVATPINDMRGTKDYRIHLVGVLLVRSLQAAVARAKGECPNYKPGH